jgi:hypothetical protein
MKEPHCLALSHDYGAREEELDGSRGEDNSETLRGEVVRLAVCWPAGSPGRGSRDANGPLRLIEVRALTGQELQATDQTFPQQVSSRPLEILKADLASLRSVRNVASSYWIAPIPSTGSPGACQAPTSDARNRTVNDTRNHSSRRAPVTARSMRKGLASDYQTKIWMAFRSNFHSADRVDTALEEDMCIGIATRTPELCAP